VPHSVPQAEDEQGKEMMASLNRPQHLLLCILPVGAHAVYYVPPVPNTHKPQHVQKPKALQSRQTRRPVIYDALVFGEGSSSKKFSDLYQHIVGFGMIRISSDRTAVIVRHDPSGGYSYSPLPQAATDN
jgi:hypothetical protein